MISKAPSIWSWLTILTIISYSHSGSPLWDPGYTTDISVWVFAIPISFTQNAYLSPRCLSTYLKNRCPYLAYSFSHLQKTPLVSTALPPLKLDSSQNVSQQRLPGCHAGWSQFVFPCSILPSLQHPAQVSCLLLSFSEYPSPWNSPSCKFLSCAMLV